MSLERWVSDDPEPGEDVQRVHDSLGDLWWRIPEPSHPASAGYHWFNGDKARPWFMLVGNRGPVTRAD